METQNKSKTLDQTCLSEIFVYNQHKDYLSPMNVTKKCAGIRIRHPYICSKCRRFKIQGFHGSFPPKNFCICSAETQTNCASMSPSPIRQRSPDAKNLIATGKAVYPKSNDFSLTEKGLAKLAIILKQAKSKPSIEDPLIDSDIKTNENLSNSKFLYLVYSGNNSKLIKSILANKTNWAEGNYSVPNEAQFIWQPVSQNIRYTRLLPYLPSQVVNHFENHFELTNKMNLFENLRSYCLKKEILINDLMPVTFALDLKSKRLNSQILQFTSYFKVLKGDGKLYKLKQPETVLSLLPDTHFVGKNIWILKPSGFNRGRGIHIFNDLDTFKTLLSSLMPGNEHKKRSHFKDCETFIIQKYIESPLLIENKRKFDIRVWVLITNSMNCYYFKEGYLRTSSEDYSIEENTFTDSCIHLTNNAIQKEGKTYGKYEKGNQLSFEYFQNTEVGNEKFENIVQQMKDLIIHSVSSVKHKLNPYNREHCFEVFGFDFIIDTNFKVWLIECNTNPCIELSSPLLEKVVPEMIAQAFELTIDRIFPSAQVSVTTNNWEHLISLKTEI